MPPDHASSQMDDEEMPIEREIGNGLNKMTSKEDVSSPEPLTRKHIWNLSFCLLAWGFTVASLTIVVGTSAVVVLSLGGGDDIASMPLGTFFLGSSLVSFAISPRVFPRWGRKIGFQTGIVFGLIGTALGAVSVKLSSPGLFIVSTFFFGMGVGMSFALRFAAVEVVPTSWASRAVTLVVSGGVMAAFVGPEASAAARDMFGEDLMYMGVFLMTGIFHIGNIICIALVRFPHQKDVNRTDRSNEEPNPPLALRQLGELMASRHFVVPMLVAVVGWAAMGMPMSLVRVVMKELGYSTTQSLRVIELHFLGMYFPGFFTGNLIRRFGYKQICYLSVLVFLVATVVAFLPDEQDDSILLWSISLILIGVGWNFTFTAGTVWVMSKGASTEKGNRQSANDTVMFLLAGAALFASSYIYKAGGSGLDGWRMLCWVVVAMICFMVVLLGLDSFLDRNDQPSPQVEESSQET